MAVRFNWRASPSASCFYAVARLVAGRKPALPEVAAALNAPVGELKSFLDAQSLPTAAVCGALTASAVTIDANRELAAAALTKAVGRGRAEPHVERLAGLLTAA